MYSEDLYLKPKPWTKHTSEAATISRWVEVTILEVSQHTKSEKEKNPKAEDETCPICMCEIYENISSKSDQEVLEAQATQLKSHDIPVIMLPQCGNHFYHKECTEGLADHGFVKCGVCLMVYGIQ